MQSRIHLIRPTDPHLEAELSQTVPVNEATICAWVIRRGRASPTSPSVMIAACARRVPTANHLLYRVAEVFAAVTSTLNGCNKGIPFARSVLINEWLTSSYIRECLSTDFSEPECGSKLVYGFDILQFLGQSIPRSAHCAHVVYHVVTSFSFPSARC